MQLSLKVFTCTPLALWSEARNWAGVSSIRTTCSWKKQETFRDWLHQYCYSPSV